MDVNQLLNAMQVKEIAGKFAHKSKKHAARHYFYNVDFLHAYCRCLLRTMLLADAQDGHYS